MWSLLLEPISSMQFVIFYFLRFRYIIPVMRIFGNLYMGDFV